MVTDFNQIAFQMIWLIPLALIILLIFQFLYILALRIAPTRREERPPAQPIMPAIYGRENAPQQAQYGQPMPQQPVMPQQYEQPMQPQYAPQPQYAQPMPPQPTPYPQAQPTPYPQQVPQSIPPQPTPYAPARPATGGMGKFVVMSGLDGPKDIAFPAATFGIGRFYSPENGVLVALDEKSVSRKHATFIADEAVREYYIKDTNSAFGTSIMVNGVFEPLTAEKQERVYNEDVLQFGNAVTVRVILPTETRATMTIL
jgi:hypothetical protein